MVGLCGLPPIEQKTLDGWGTAQFHLPWVRNPGDALIQNSLPIEFFRCLYGTAAGQPFTHGRG